MVFALHPVALGLALLAPLGSQGSLASSDKAKLRETPMPASGSRLARWLSRPVGLHPELLEHGNLSPFVDVGLPFAYRLGLRVGILDILTVGVIAQYRDPKLGIRWSPELGLALYRGRSLSLGLRYRYLFHPSPTPPPSETKPTPQQGGSKPKETKGLPKPAFFRKTHYLAGSLVWSSGYVSAGIEAGATYRRELDQGQKILDPYLFSMQWRPMMGALLRVGTPRWGVMLQAMVPSPELSLRFEWRYALFSVKKRRDPLSWALYKAQERDRKLRALRSAKGLTSPAQP